MQLGLGRRPGCRVVVCQLADNERQIVVAAATAVNGSG
jgi:hypothetical protein